jgi:glycosyltransferase involved in cell wall biosynthesis
VVSQKTLIAHEWLERWGGAENVVEQLQRAMPTARLLALWNDAPTRFTDTDETWLARTPLRGHKAASIPFHALTWRTVRLRNVERIVASSHAFSHQLAYRAALTGRAAFAYVHTPARYIWSPDSDHRGQGAVPRAAARVLGPHDRSHTSAAVSYAANSMFVRDRVQRAWDQPAEVIYPPVAVEAIQSRGDWASSASASEQEKLACLPDVFVLGASRLVEYTRLDLTIATAEALGVPAVIAGSGPLEASLRELGRAASVPVTFLGRVSDPMLYALFLRAALFVFMAVEDFGIIPVEAMAAGTPVLVNEVGGAAETVALTSGGRTVNTLAGSLTLKRAAEEAISVDRADLRQKSLRFSESVFRGNIRKWLGEVD